MLKFLLYAACLTCVVQGGYLHDPVVQPVPAASTRIVTYPLELLGTNLASSYVRTRNGPRPEASRPVSVRSPYFVQASYASPTFQYSIQPAPQSSFLRPVQYVAAPGGYYYSYSRSEGAPAMTVPATYSRLGSMPQVTTQGISANKVIGPANGVLRQQTYTGYTTNGPSLGNGYQVEDNPEPMNMQNEAEQQMRGQNGAVNEGQSGNVYPSNGPNENPVDGQNGQNVPSNENGGPANGQNGSPEPTMPIGPEYPPNGQNGESPVNGQNGGPVYPVKGQNGGPGYPINGQNGNGQSSGQGQPMYSGKDRVQWPSSGYKHRKYILVPIDVISSSPKW